MRLLFITFIVPLLYSCTNNRLVKEVELFTGKHIILSSDLRTVYNGKDTVLANFTEVPIKLIVWYDSLVCSSCQVSQMHEWCDIINYSDSLAQWFSIVYIFSPKYEDMDNVNMLLKVDKLSYPVFIDPNTTFVRENPELPQNNQLHSFLIDRNNKVVLIGNPLYNPSLWALYKRTIQKMIDNDGVLPDK